MTTEPLAVFLVGIISREDRAHNSILQVLDGQFGRRFKDVPPYKFDFTDFYEDELGEPLTRSWYIYESLFNPADIPSRKQFAMSVEEQFTSSSGNRLFNVDVGFVTGAKFVLASRKNYSNRVYMGDDVYTEVTLRYEGGQWRDMPNTYPEFSSGKQRECLNTARSYWNEKTNELSRPKPDKST